MMKFQQILFPQKYLAHKAISKYADAQYKYLVSEINRITVKFNENFDHVVEAFDQVEKHINDLSTTNNVLNDDLYQINIKQSDLLADFHDFKYDFDKLADHVHNNL